MVFGFTVYDSFETPEVAQTGDVPLPSGTDTLIGGHCVLTVGYDDEDHVFICRNSWGMTWGDAGYFYMPYSYLLDNNLSADFWTINLVGQVSHAGSPIGETGPGGWVLKALLLL